MRRLKSLIFIFIIFICANSFAYQTNNDTLRSDSIPYSLQVLSAYLQIPSYSGSEYEAGKYLIKACEDNGLYVTVFTDTGGSINFAASLYPLSLNKPNIILQHHIDVVPEGKHSEWKYPPFSGTIAEGKIWGRGAVDIKSLGVMHLIAISKFKELSLKKDLPYNFTLLAVSEEETNGNGAKTVVNNFWPQLNAVLLLGESGSGVDFIFSATRESPIFGISIAEKTSLWIKLVLDMETLAHGSISLNEYPNKIMIDALSRINKRLPSIKLNKASKRMFKEIASIMDGIEGFILENMNWIIFRPFIGRIFIKDPSLYATTSNTITITSINSDKGAHNQIAQRIEATLDCRLLTNTDEEKLIMEIQSLIKDKRIKIEVINSSAKSYVTIPEYHFYLFKEAIKNNYKNSKVIPFYFPASSDNNYFRSTGIPVYGILPAVLTKKQLNSIHNYNENISVESFLKGIDVFETFINLLIQDGIKK